MTDSTRKAHLADQLALIAKTYGQVTNAVWFAREIRNYEATGQHELADRTKAVAQRHGIDWQAGMREIESAPGFMRKRQAA